MVTTCDLGNGLKGLEVGRAGLFGSLGHASRTGEVAERECHLPKGTLFTKIVRYILSVFCPPRNISGSSRFRFEG